MNLKPFIIMLASTLLPLGSSAQNVLPKPQQMTIRKGYFRLNSSALNIENKVGEMSDNVFVANWGKAARNQNINAKQTVRYERLSDPSPEAYQLHITADTLLIKAADKEGFMRAWQTIAQLTTKRGVACCDIADRPAYRWRGIMIDVSRHFFPIDFLKKQIDILAGYKINRLQLHLTDAEGWRMEIERYPRLTQLTAYRQQVGWHDWDDNGRRFCTKDSAGAYGGFYTQDELRQLVSYAAERGIAIVPEIEMPGHSGEVLTAYPELSCTHKSYGEADYCPGNIGTYDFLEHVLEEVMAVFPSHYIHIGGDEARKKAWPNCPLCQTKMKELGLTSVNDLQPYLISRISQFLKGHDRSIIGWDEITDNKLVPGSMVMVWRDAAKAHEAIEKGYDVVMTPIPYCYLNAYQDAPFTQPEAIGGYISLEKAYNYNPAEGLTNDERKHVAGLQGNLWTEYIVEPELAEYMLYPRTLAIAETGWNGTEKKDYAEFKQRAEQQLKWLKAQGVATFNLNKEYGERKEALKPMVHKAVGARITDNRRPEKDVSQLVDGKFAGWTFRNTKWTRFGAALGMDVTIDLGKETAISSVKADFMKSIYQDIFYPSQFSVEYSSDGNNYTMLTQQQPEPNDTGVPETTYYQWSGHAKARYLRLKASRADKSGLLFIDEIIVK